MANAPHPVFLHDLIVQPPIMEILRHTQISQTRRYVKGRSHLSKGAMRRTGNPFLPARAQRRRRIRQKQKPQVTASES